MGTGEPVRVSLVGARERSFFGARDRSIGEAKLVVIQVAIESQKAMVGNIVGCLHFLEPNRRR